LPDGADLYIETVCCRGVNHTLVHSLAYTAIQNYRMPTLSEEEIEKKGAELESQFRDTFKNNPEQGKFYIETAREIVRKHYTQKSIQSRLTVKYSTPNLTQRLFSLLIERRNEQNSKWEPQTHVIEDNTIDKKSASEGAAWFPQERSARINKNQAAMEPFLNFGRVRGHIVPVMEMMLLQGTNPGKYEFSKYNIDKFKTERQRQKEAGIATALQTVGTVKYDGEADAYLVESSIDKQLVERYWIDAARGYICPLVQYYDKSGKILAEYKAQNYFLHEKSGLWFPTVYIEMTTDPEGKQQIKEYHIDPITININFPVAAAEFSITLPEGCEVIDSREKKEVRYVPIVDCTISLGELGLDITGRLKHIFIPVDDLVKGKKFPWLEFAVRSTIHVGMILIIVFLYHFIRNRLRNKKAPK
jgi:hypothetical protein